LGLLALHFIHGYIRWMPRPWYFPAWALVTYVSLGVTLGILNEMFQQRGSSLGRAVRAGSIGLALIALLELQHTYLLLKRDRSPHQAEMVADGRGIAESIPTEERIDRLTLEPVQL
jgi:hypothetical protein